MRNSWLCLLVVGCAKPVAPAAPTPEAPAPVTLPDRIVIDGIRGVGLLRAESMEGEEILATWAKDQGMEVVPVPEVHATLDHWMRGTREEHEHTCSALSRRESTQRVFGSSIDGALNPVVLCNDDGCHLSLRLSTQAGWRGTHIQLWSGPWDPALPWQESLVRALAGTEVSLPSGRGGLMAGIEGRGGPVEARPERLGFSSRFALSSQEADNHDPSWFVADETALKQCFIDTQRSGVELLVAVDANGAVTGCESRNANHREDLCACDVVRETAKVVPDLHDSRVFLGISYRPADVITKGSGIPRPYIRTYLESYTSERGEARWRERVTDESIRDWRRPSDLLLAPCFVDRESMDAVKIMADIHFGPDGQATAVDLEGGTSAEQACVRKVMIHASAPCPSTDDPVASAEIRVDFKELALPTK